MGKTFEAFKQHKTEQIQDLVGRALVVKFIVTVAELLL
jgi:hypothetical protein